MNAYVSQENEVKVVQKVPSTGSTVIHIDIDHDRALTVVVFLVCRRGRFGPSCSQNCTCENDAHCDSVTGQCSCEPGFIGPNCEKPCPDGLYGKLTLRSYEFSHEIKP